MTQRVETAAEPLSQDSGGEGEGAASDDRLSPASVARTIALDGAGQPPAPAGGGSLLGRALARAVALDLTPAKEIRDVLVLADPLSEETSAGGLAWSLLSGAALLLERDPALFLPAVLWARPTVFWGRRDQVEALEAALPEGSRRPGRRHPLRRLRAIVAVGQGPWRQDRWRQFGVSVARLPS
ncbi:MAG: hypothetical protein AAF481_15170 [Acidobacteriota bacterium]